MPSVKLDGVGSGKKMLLPVGSAVEHSLVLDADFSSSARSPVVSASLLPEYPILSLRLVVVVGSWRGDGLERLRARICGRRIELLGRLPPSILGCRGQHVLGRQNRAPGETCFRLVPPLELYLLAVRFLLGFPLVYSDVITLSDGRAKRSCETPIGSVLCVKVS